MASFVRPYESDSGDVEKTKMMLMMGKPSQSKAPLNLAACALSSRRIRIAGAMVVLLLVSIISFRLTSNTPAIFIPQFSLTHNHHDSSSTTSSPYNASKVALLIEDRPLPVLAPLTLHMMAVLPPDWSFRFLGSPSSIAHINTSAAIRDKLSTGKLTASLIPDNMTTGGQEQISQFLTTLWVYETLLQPAEWLLVYQTDSVLCANSRQNLDDYLEYDWVGSPWGAAGSQYGGNGGLSLRRVSAIVEVLRDQVRREGSEPEDVWLSERLGHRTGNKMANGTVSLGFSGEMHEGEKEVVAGRDDEPKDERKDEPKDDKEPNGNARAKNVKGIDDYRHGFYEPMGYHTGGSGRNLAPGVWGKPELRQHIWHYCPEVKMTLQMDVARFVPGDCHSTWT
jgi:hypothetical protein